MNAEQLSFVNQQLAGMLRHGIPLEGALERLCREMASGELRTELTELEGDLRRGRPLAEAAAARRLPEFYVRMLQVGSRSDDLPGILALVADHYQQSHLVWTRLKGLLVYPLLVALGALGLAVFVAVVFGRLLSGDDALGVMLGEYSERGGADLRYLVWGMWVPVGLLGLLIGIGVAAGSMRVWRRRLGWRLPGFREGSVARLGSTLGLLLRSGGSLGEALDVARHLEEGSPAEAELAGWKRRLGEGRGKFADVAAGSRVIPPLFVWIVEQAGEDLAAGFRRASEIYAARAQYRVDLLLYAALPVSVLVLGVMILGEFLPMLRMMTGLLDLLGSPVE